MAGWCHDVTTYMVVERFKTNCYSAVYDRYHAKGRMLPEGLHYLNSWNNENHSVCFQLMETNDKALFDTWITHWNDLVEFEIYPID